MAGLKPWVLTNNFNTISIYLLYLLSYPALICYAWICRRSMTKKNKQTNKNLECVFFNLFHFSSSSTLGEWFWTQAIFWFLVICVLWGDILPHILITTSLNIYVKYEETPWRLSKELLTPQRENLKAWNLHTWWVGSKNRLVDKKKLYRGCIMKVTHKETEWVGKTAAYKHEKTPGCAVCILIFV